MSRNFVKNHGIDKRKVVGKKKLMVFAQKFGPYTLMDLNHKKGQGQGVSSLIRKVNKISCPTN
jgi:hypothetical protein